MLAWSQCPLHTHTPCYPLLAHMFQEGLFTASLSAPLSQEGGIVEDLPLYLAELSQVSSVPSFGPGSAL